MRGKKLFRYLAALALTGLVVSCADAPMAPTQPEQPTVQTGEIDPNLIGGLLGGVGRLVGGLITCRPQPFVSSSATIGPWGGVLRIGEHTLLVPPGSLNRTITIRAEAPRDDVLSLRFKPEGLQFVRPVYLTLDYSNCGLLGALLDHRTLKVVYTNESLQVLEVLPSVENRRNRTVTGQLQHFSRYALAW